MKKIFLNRAVKNFFLMFITIFSTEIIFRIVMNIPIFEWSLFRIATGTIAVSLLLAIAFSFFGRIAGNLLTIFTCLLTSAYAIIQAGFENYLGVYLSIKTSSQAGAVTDYITDYIKSFKNEFYYILIPLGLLVLYFLIIERLVKKTIQKKEISSLNIIYSKPDNEKLRLKYNNKLSLIKTRVVLGITSIIMFSLFYYSTFADYMQNELQLVSTNSLFVNPEIPNIAVNQFGISLFGLLDIKSSILPESITSEVVEYQKPEQEITDYTRYIDDTAWETIALSEKNNNFIKLNNYYMSKEITPENDYTGIFADKNLIVIMLESVNDIVLNEEYFPNIYKLYSEGWSWDNAYSPRNSCSTGNNEMSGMTSLFSINLTCTANYYKYNTYPNSIFQLFNEEGYHTSSYHNYPDYYYDRSVIHQNMGSSIFYDVDDLNIPWNPIYEEWPSDVTLMENASDIFLQNEQYMAWITTVTSHQPYYVSSEYGDKYLDLFEGTEYTLSLKRYLSKLKELDNSIGALLDSLTAAGELEDTVIVLYGDHYPYGLTKGTIEQALDYDVNINYEVDQTPFIIYNSEMTPTKFDEYTSFMNIIPTIANLFDLDYDPRLYAGEDLLSETYDNRVIFADGSWQNEIAFYNAATSRISYYGEEEYTTEEIIEINKNVIDKIKMSNLAITTNYFADLNQKINKYNNENTIAKLEE